MMNQENLDSFQKLTHLHKESDPLAYLLITRLRLTPISFGLLSIVVTLASQFPLAYVSNALLVSLSDRIGILEDLNFWIWCLLLQPVIFGYYLWSVNALEYVVESLQKLETIESFDKNIKLIKICYKKRYRLFISLMIATFATFILDVSNQIFEKSWLHNLKFAKIIVTINFFIDAYLLSMLLTILLANIWILHKVIKINKLNINPLHPDRCGGLSPLSHYSLKTAYLAAVFGVVISLVEYSVITTETSFEKHWFLHLSIPLYFFLSLGCFFGPLFAANTGMRNAKNKLLGDIAKQFQDDYHQTHKNLKSEAETLKLQFAKINQLRSWYRLTDEFPIWPFDLKTLRKYLLSVSTPLIPILIGALQHLTKILYSRWFHSHYVR